MGTTNTRTSTIPSTQTSSWRQQWICRLCLRRLKLHQSRMLQDFWSQVLHEGWLHSFLSVQRSSGLVGTCDPQIECVSTRTSTGTSTQTSTRSSTPKRTDGTCSAAFGQCGDKNWNGPTCCQSGCQCR